MPGWYPDPTHPNRRRYRGERGWTSLTTTLPPTGVEPAPSAGPAVGRSRATAPGRTGRRHLAVAAAAGAAALVALVVLAVRGTGGATDTAVSGPRPQPSAPTTLAPTTGPATAPTTAPTTATTPAAPEAPATQAPEVPAPPPPAPVVVEPCTLDPTVALRLLREAPSLAPLARQLRVSDPRCANGWATVVVSTASTDDALAVLREDGGGWRLVLVGDAEPCSGLGIPVEVEPVLACDRASG